MSGSAIGVGGDASLFHVLKFAIQWLCQSEFRERKRKRERENDGPKDE